MNDEEMDWSEEARIDHLAMAYDVLEAWMLDPLAIETRGLFRYSVTEFHPEMMVMTLTSLLSALVEGHAEKVGATYTEALGVLHARLDLPERNNA